MTEILLSNEDYVRASANIDNNLQSKYILSALREAQSVGLQQIIGSAMLKKLQNLIASGEILDYGNLAYKNLVDESQLYLAYQTTANLCLITNVKISNGGLQQTSDENLTALNINDSFTLQKHYQDKADFFAKRLQQYIINNIKVLPEISESRCNEMRAELRSAASTSVFLGGARSKVTHKGLFPPYLYK